MTTSHPSAKAFVLALPLLSVIAGCCCQAIPCLPDERHCPTDARRLYWTFGEEAVRRCPCGPDREFYGLKPTEWRSWPEGWRCNDGRWEAPISEPESAYAESMGAPPIEESSVALNPDLGKKELNPFSHVTKPQPPTDGISPMLNPAQQKAEPITTNPPVAKATPKGSAATIPAFEQSPIIKFPDTFKPLSEIQAPVTTEVQTPPAAKELDATPARSVPHVEPTLSDRVQQHLLDSLTL